ncbi:MAG TPA: (E)-4-hydroxy-3-methylbut-2-enyl-diphosphate synthase [Opitutales bacterium]|jgi:(E)-4-hydroxy-3-methylbut-2-enyl-diphosphate synthase|nr:(E)-4-hydroxy-3-methylbut-2-enyl-diphosphate synthase [Opitutales bacterium]
MSVPVPGSTPDTAHLLPYCASRFRAVRRPTREVKVGVVGVGGANPIRVQSMTTSLTQDVAATVRQTLALAEAGCEIVRITAPNKEAAHALKEIRAQVTAAGWGELPLVADIHFLPVAAMEAVEHVEKVRVNPGNYADKKKFAVKEYSDNEYENELQRLHDAFSPLVKRAKELGRALRIGTNHGSLSDRLMNRYGDTPLGMVESALEFIRICQSHGFHDIILSMKASNPKVMIEAYRLAVSKMAAENMYYPLHLGVTEAGEGEDARIKSAIGIGTMLMDGLGDTIRVSLTEDAIYEVPVCLDIAKRAHALWERGKELPDREAADAVDPFVYTRRDITHLHFGESCEVSRENPPRVIIPASRPLAQHAEIVKDVLKVHTRNKETKIEGLLVALTEPGDLAHLATLQRILAPTVKFFVVDLPANNDGSALRGYPRPPAPTVWCRRFETGDKSDIEIANTLLDYAGRTGGYLAVDTVASVLAGDFGAALLRHAQHDRVILTQTTHEAHTHAVGGYRALAREAKKLGLRAPLWLRHTPAQVVISENFFTARLLEASMVAGNLLCDGLGDFLSVETEPDYDKTVALTYNILQGARTRSTKTEFVACPSCGRTLFDLQTTTQRIKGRTGHLKGVTIAVMGCIVNGPGEMADADFGYVGGAPAKVNLYVGKECVKYNIPEDEAVDKLVDLIREHGKWVEPELVPAGV